jgi:hypothetical protein
MAELPAMAKRIEDLRCHSEARTMPSPFPGMDPYLEAPGIWSDFHHAFATELSSALNHTLPRHYYSRLETRPEIGIVEPERQAHQPVPDITVVRHPRHPADGGGVAVLGRARVEVSKSYEVDVLFEPIRHPFVEIRDPSSGHKLITLIEILSPSNKRPGPDRKTYLKKQREVLASNANLIELDLLRRGQRATPHFRLEAFLAALEPPPAYVVLVNRAERRVDGNTGYQVFPCRLREWLPCIPVPLRPGEPDVPLDLQFVVNAAYDRGPYNRGAVDYARPPEPPLSGDDVAWAEALLRERGRPLA